MATKIAGRPRKISRLNGGKDYFIEVKVVTEDSKTARDFTTEDFLTMDIDVLLQCREAWREQGRHLLDLAGKADFAIIQQMSAKGATVHASDEWEAKVGPGTRSYSYHMDVLEALKPLLRDGEWDQLVKERTVFDVDKRTMNRLELRGGDIALIVQRATMESEGPPKLTVKRVG